MEKQTCCCTGHRPDRFPWGYDETDSRCLALKEELKQQVNTLYLQGYHHFITGMALGTDQYFAEIVLSLQKEHEEISLECAIPCPSQPNAWSEEQKKRYQNILEAAQMETLVQHHYSRGCMMRRNRYMIDRSQAVLCVYDGNPKGGTAQTIAYAMKNRLELMILSLQEDIYL
ncbi:MAG: SLOG family protein [Eubacteriales bacterium]